MVKVILSNSEIKMSIAIGSERNFESIMNNRKDNYGRKYSPGWSEHIEGAGGELAVAKLLGLYWDGSINSFSRADIGNNIQVRTRSNSEYDLIVRENDSDNHIFVLVVGKIPEFDVIGWIRGSSAKNNQWSQTYGGRPSAYFVPQEVLNTDFICLKEETQCV